MTNVHAEWVNVVHFWNSWSIWFIPAGGGGGQNAATRRNMRREERVTVQGPVKKQQPDGMSHRGGGLPPLDPLPPPLKQCPGGGGVPPHPPTHPPFKMLCQIFLWAFGGSEVFSGAFRANWFRPKIFFGAFAASKSKRCYGVQRHRVITRNRRIGTPHGTSGQRCRLQPKDARCRRARTAPALPRSDATPFDRVTAITAPPNRLEGPNV